MRADGNRPSGGAYARTFRTCLAHRDGPPESDHARTIPLAIDRRIQPTGGTNERPSILQSADRGQGPYARPAEVPKRCYSKAILTLGTFRDMLLFAAVDNATHGQEIVVLFCGRARKYNCDSCNITFEREIRT